MSTTGVRETREEVARQLNKLNTIDNCIERREADARSLQDSLERLAAERTEVRDRLNKNLAILGLA